MPFMLKSCIVWQDEQGSTHCIKKHENENGAFYCTQDVIREHIDVTRHEYIKLAPSGVMYMNKTVTRW